MTAGDVRHDGLRWQMFAPDGRLVAGGRLDADGCFVVQLPVAHTPHRVQVDVLDAVPDVPPDPPAADRDELARIFAKHLYLQLMQETRDYWPEWQFVPSEVQAGYLRDGREAVDEAIASGVLVAAADVRARFAEELADVMPPVLGNAARQWLRRRAVSERDRGTT